MNAIRNPRSMTDFLLALTGPIVWAVHFMFLYFWQSWICVTASRPQLVFAIVAVVMTLAALGAIAVFVWRQYRNVQMRRSARDDGPIFLQGIGVALGILSAVAILWVTLPSTMLAACGTGVI